MAHVRRELGPRTEVTLRRVGARGQRTVIVVPIAFTSDHIETLSELDIEYAHVAKIAGVTNFIRAGALNDEPVRTASRNSLPVASMV